jgi:hypothetical protein
MFLPGMVNDARRALLFSPAIAARCGNVPLERNERDEARPDDECIGHGLTSCSTWTGMSGTRVCCATPPMSMV